MAVLTLTGDYVLTDTSVAALRAGGHGHRFNVVGQGMDEAAARAMLFERIVNTVAIVLTPQPADASALMPGFKAAELHYVVDPKDLTLPVPAIHRMSFAWNDLGIGNPRREALRRYHADTCARRLVTECRTAGVLPYRQCDPQAVSLALLEGTILINEARTIPATLPAGEHAVVVLGAAGVVHDAGLEW